MHFSYIDFEFDIHVWNKCFWNNPLTFEINVFEIIFQFLLYCTETNNTFQHHGGTTIHVPYHYDDVIMDAIESLITSLTIVYSTVYSDADQRKHQSSASLAFVWGIHRGPVNSPHKWPVTRKMLPLDDVIMILHLSHRSSFEDTSLHERIPKY